MRDDTHPYSKMIAYALQDRIVEAEGKEIRCVNDVLRQASKMTYGKTLRLTIERGTEKQDLKITAGDGL